MTVTDAVVDAPSSGPASDDEGRLRRWARRIRPVEAVPVLVLWAPMLVWFAALKPGVMTNDSTNIWGQVVTGVWVDWHPPVYTALMWVSYELIASPAIATLAQSLALAWAIARILKLAVRLGVPAVPLYAVAALVALTPPIGAFSVHLWKDVPYTIGFLLVVELFVRQVLARLDLEPGPTTTSWVLGGVGLLTLLLTRPNGIVVVLVTAVAILVVTTRRRVAAGVWVGAFAASMLVQSAVYPLIGVGPPVGTASGGLGPFALGYLAVEHPDAMDADEIRLLERLAPLELWQEHYSCHWTGIPVRELTPSAAVTQWADELKAAWREAVLEHPYEMTLGHLCAASVAWNPVPSDEERRQFETLYYTIVPNEFGLHTAPLSSGLNEVARDVLARTTPPPSAWQPWLWRGATWIYVCAVLAIFAAVVRRSAGPLVVLAPLVAQQLSVIAMTGPHARYMLPAGIAAVMVLPVLGRVIWLARLRADEPTDVMVDAAPSGPASDAVTSSTDRPAHR